MIQNFHPLDDTMAEAEWNENFPDLPPFIRRNRGDAPPIANPVDMTMCSLNDHES